VQHCDIRAEEADVRHVADEARAFQMSLEQRVMKPYELVAPAKARPVERNEVDFFGKRRRERLAAAAIPTVHRRQIQTTYLVRVRLPLHRVTTVNPHGCLLNLFVNPTAIGNGLRIFTGMKPLKLDGSTPYPCGIVSASLAGLSGWLGPHATRSSQSIA
jgi:hypothetical protein